MSVAGVARYAVRMSNVRSMLLVQAGARALCVAGAFSAFDWQRADASFGSSGWTESIQLSFVGLKLVGILLGIGCWAHWRRALQGVVASPHHCSVCLHQSIRERCPECGTRERTERRVDALGKLLRLQTNGFARLWNYYAVLILVRIAGIGVLAASSARSGGRSSAAFSHWFDASTGSLNWIWIEAPFSLLSVVLLVMTIGVLRKHASGTDGPNAV